MLICRVAPAGTRWKFLGCTTCFEIKPASEFSRHPTCGDGHLNRCKACCNDDNRERYARSEKTRESFHRSRARVSPEVKRAYARRWKERNVEAVRADTNSRRRRLRLQCPAWADRKAIREFYRNCPLGHEVDHVIPLRGSTVSGLHVLENLQYLPKGLNRLKSNRFEDPS